MIKENLKKLRKEKNISQKKLTNDINISYANYNKYETTDVNPDIETLIKIADYYQVSLDYIVGRNFGNKIGYLTENQITFVNSFLALNNANQMNAVIYVSSLLANQ